MSKAKTNEEKTKQTELSPLDRLIFLIAHIEVEKYLREINDHGCKDNQHENSHLRTL